MKWKRLFAVCLIVCGEADLGAKKALPEKIIRKRKKTLTKFPGEW